MPSAFDLAILKVSGGLAVIVGNLTKRDLTMRISNETGLVQRQVDDIIQRFMDHLMKSLANGQTIELRKFGVFEAKMRKARIGRNPHLPAYDVPIPARWVVKFKAGKDLKAKLEKVALPALLGDVS